MAQHVLASSLLAHGAAVALYWPMHDEIDVRPLLAALFERGHPTLLPVTPSPGQRLIFRRWTPATRMVAERFGTLCPEDAAPEAVPAMLFVPLLAFDRAGRRLGYGGGFYDRTLAALSGAVAVGCGFAAQELDEVPAGDYDVRLSAVATEGGVIFCESS